MSLSFQILEEITQAWCGAHSYSSAVSRRPGWLEEWSLLHKISLGDPVLKEGDKEGSLLSWEEISKDVHYRRCAQLFFSPELS